MSGLIALTLLAILSASDTSGLSGADSGITFEYRILPPENGNSSVDVKGDTVAFEFYYVDVDCNENYEYEFELRNRFLVVRRVLLDPNRCKKDEELLYAVKGTIAGVPKGRYGFVLEIENPNSVDTVDTEAIRIK